VTERASSGVAWTSATAEELFAHLGELDMAAFEQAVRNESFTEEHVRALLKDPGLPSDLVERVSREARFFRANVVRVALALHPALPRVRGLEILRYLWWRDLLRVAAAPKAHPQLRAVAEALVSERIPDLTLGERIQIARTCGRGVLRALRTDPSPRVIEALLRNFRCTEEDAIFMATSQDSVPEALAVLARHVRWRARPAVRLQLVRNRRLRLPLALALLPDLSRGELESVSRQADLPRLLRHGAHRLLAERSGKARGGQRAR
jgi:hypothetical protein